MKEEGVRVRTGMGVKDDGGEQLGLAHSDRAF